MSESPASSPGSKRKRVPQTKNGTTTGSAESSPKKRRKEEASLTMADKEAALVVSQLSKAVSVAAAVAPPLSPSRTGHPAEPTLSPQRQQQQQQSPASKSIRTGRGVSPRGRGRGGGGGGYHLQVQPLSISAPKLASSLPWSSSSFLPSLWPSSGYVDEVSEQASMDLFRETAERDVGQFLSSAFAQQFCRYEWFYSPIDRAIFSQNDLEREIERTWAKRPKFLTKAGWSSVRSKMAAAAARRRRRFSSAFVRTERITLIQCREKIRELQQMKRQIYARDVLDGLPLPSEIPVSLVVGQEVTVRYEQHEPSTASSDKTGSLSSSSNHRKFRFPATTSAGFHVGSIVAVDTARIGYHVQLAEPDSRTIFVEDTDIMPHGPQQTYSVISSSSSPEKATKIPSAAPAPAAAPIAKSGGGRGKEGGEENMELEPTRLTFAKEVVSPPRSSSPGVAAAVEEEGRLIADVSTVGGGGERNFMREKLHDLIRDADLSPKKDRRPHDAVTNAVLEDARLPGDGIEDDSIVFPEALQEQIARALRALSKLLSVKDILLGHLKRMNAEAQMCAAQRGESDATSWSWDEQFQRQYAWLVVHLRDINSAVNGAIRNLRSLLSSFDNSNASAGDEYVRQAEDLLNDVFLEELKVNTDNALNLLAATASNPRSKGDGLSPKDSIEPRSKVASLITDCVAMLLHLKSAAENPANILDLDLSLDTALGALMTKADVVKNERVLRQIEQTLSAVRYGLSGETLRGFVVERSPASPTKKSLIA